MNKNFIFIFSIYLILICIVNVIMTIIDKSRAIKNKWRIKEKVLLGLALLGGAMAQYITMKIIRHKTLHKKFMIGLPLIFVFHIIIILFFVVLKFKII